MSHTSELMILDPRTGENVARVPVADAHETKRAVAAARAGLRDWAHMPAGERASRVRSAAASVETAAKELAELVERETGKPLDDALGGVQAGVDTLRQYADVGPLHRGRSLQGDWAATDLMIAEPRGVVAVLTPWNDQSGGRPAADSASGPNCWMR